MLHLITMIVCLMFMAQTRATETINGTSEDRSFKSEEFGENAFQ